MSEWKEYTGSDEQIAEIQKSKFIYRYTTQSGKIVESYITDMLWQAQVNNLSNYWIIPDDPLREMKIRQAQTGQPVWIRYKSHRFDWDSMLGSVMADDLKTEITTRPNWNIPNAEYSFKPFEDKP